VTDEQHFVTYDKDPKYVLARDRDKAKTYEQSQIIINLYRHTAAS
jgi:hypothetical protein